MTVVCSSQFKEGSCGSSVGFRHGAANHGCLGGGVCVRVCGWVGAGGGGKGLLMSQWLQRQVQR
jgi:hypothetical protein